jgi:hypothetical protein
MAVLMEHSLMYMDLLYGLIGLVHCPSEISLVPVVAHTVFMFAVRDVQQTVYATSTIPVELAMISKFRLAVPISMVNLQWIVVVHS